jgi:hypothetical protein
MAAATSAPDAIKQQYQQQKASTRLSSPGSESPVKVMRPDLAESEGNFTASAIAATATTDILRQQYQLESVTGGGTGSGLKPDGSMQGKASGNATATRKNGAGRLLV